MAQDTFQYQDHLNLKSRGFLVPLSQASEEEYVQHLCNRQLSGTVTSFLVACLYTMHSCVDEYSEPTSPNQQPNECHSQAHKPQSYPSEGNSGVDVGSSSNTRSSGSIVFMFYVKTLLVAWVDFIAMKSNILREQ